MQDAGFLWFGFRYESFRAGVLESKREGKSERRE
jgi:hypothetical protein